MTRKFLLAFLALSVSLVLQAWLAGAGIFLDLSFATLIALAFFLDFLELLTLALGVAFVLNWQPAPSATLAFLAGYPCLIHLLYRLAPWQIWIMIPAAIVVGFTALLFVAAPGSFAAAPGLFFGDLFAGILFGYLAFFSLARA